MTNACICHCLEYTIVKCNVMEYNLNQPSVCTRNFSRLAPHLWKHWTVFLPQVLLHLLTSFGMLSFYNIRHLWYNQYFPVPLKHGYCHIFWILAEKTLSSKTVFLSNLAHKFVYRIVSKHLLLANIINLWHNCRVSGF